MTSSRAAQALHRAAEVLGSVVPDLWCWPGDLDESVPAWTDLGKRLDAVARQVMSGAEVVRDSARKSVQDRELEAVADRLVSMVGAATDARVADRSWLRVAESFRDLRQRCSTPPQKGHQPVRVVSVAEPVGEAARLARAAAGAQLAPTEIGPVLTAAMLLSNAMRGLVAAISVGLERRDKEYPALTRVSRILHRQIHHCYLDMSEHFDTAAMVYEKLTARWPDRWPTGGVVGGGTGGAG